MNRVYLDYNASTPIAPEVLEEMYPLYQPLTSERFIGLDANEILNKIPELAASTGSACHAGMTTISPVLKAMHVDEPAARGAIRFSLGRYTVKEDIDFVMKLLEKAITI